MQDLNVVGWRGRTEPKWVYTEFLESRERAVSRFFRPMHEGIVDGDEHVAVIIIYFHPINECVAV